MAIGAKRYETRSWSTPYRGPLVIAAAKGWPLDAQALVREQPFARALEIGGVSVLDLHATRGHLLCVVELVDCIRVAGDLPRVVYEIPPPAEHERDFGDYSAGRFAWVTRNLERLPRPIAAKGRLGVWPVWPADEIAIQEQLGA